VSEVRIISKHRPDEDYHEWWMPGEIRWLDSLGRVNHGGGYHRWHVLQCNNGACPAEAVVREDTITALVPMAGAR
jgi:hypothetical protein